MGQQRYQRKILGPGPRDESPVVVEEQPEIGVNVVAYGMIEIQEPVLAERAGADVVADKKTAEVEKRVIWLEGSASVLVSV